MEHANSNGPPAPRSRVRMIDLIVAFGLLGGWIALQAWVLPAMGVRT
jgi:hypothetical protein